jgi:small conductance mechanosensitive channel
MIQISKGKDLILSILNENPKVLQTPHQSFVKNLTDSAIELYALGQNEDYGAVLLKH